MEEKSFIAERSDSLFREATLQKFRKAKSFIQKSAIWIFVGGVIFAALLIVSADSSEFSMIAKIVGTLMILALMLGVSAYDFAKIENGNKETQVFAFIGVVTNVLWALLWIGQVWNLYSFSTENCIGTSRSYYRSTACSAYEVSFLGKLAFISTFMSIMGLFGAAILGIKEYDKRSTIRPLKITGVACLVYEMLFMTAVTFMNFHLEDNVIMPRLAALAGLAGFVWFVSGIIASIISKSVKNSKENAKTKALIEKGHAAEAPASAPASAPAQKTDDELRAEIEEKVRREMIEKEVRERLEKEMAAKNSENSED